jgi:iron complex outermembrane receptor protein
MRPVLLLDAARHLGPVLTVAVAAAGQLAAPASAAAAATLSGTVSAPDGARLAAVVITLAPRDNGAIVRAVSGPLGAFHLAGLAPGVYDLTATLAGFAPRRVPDLRLADRVARRLDIQLGLAVVREKIEVVTGGPDETIEAAELRESSARDAAEALSGLPGVTRTRRGLIGSDVAIRGFRGQDVTVLVDGQRICGACPSRMDPPAFHVDLGEIERVEVTRGPFDVKNGGGMGGAVNVVTRRPPPGWRVQPTLVLGSAGYVNPVLAGSWGGRGASALAGLSYRQAQPFADGTGQPALRVANYREGMSTSDAYRIGTAWARALRHSDSGLLQLAYTRQRAEHALYPTLLMDAINDDTDRGQLTWEGTHTRLVVAASRVTHWMTDEYRVSTADAPRGYSMGTRAKSETFGLRGERQGGGVTLGIEVGHRFWDAQTEMAGNNYKQQSSLAGATSDSVGLFAEYERDFSVAHGLSAGLRLDRATTHVDVATGNTDLFAAYHGTRETRRADLLPAARLRYNWRPHAGLHFMLTAGHAARTPEPNERYYALRRMGSDWVGNPTLRSSRNTGLDLAARVDGARVRLRTSVFVNSIADYITMAARQREQLVAGVTNTLARTYENVDATLFGAEARASLVLPARLFLDAQASYVRGTQSVDASRGLTSHAVAEMPPLEGRGALRYDGGGHWLRLELVAAASQSRVNLDLGETKTPGYGVVNLSAGLRTRHLSFTAGVVNLLDKLYVEHLSSQRDPFRSGARLFEPGRQIFANAVVPF